MAVGLFWKWKVETKMARAWTWLTLTWNCSCNILALSSHIVTKLSFAFLKLSHLKYQCSPMHIATDTTTHSTVTAARFLHHLALTKPIAYSKFWNPTTRSQIQLDSTLGLDKGGQAWAELFSKEEKNHIFRANLLLLLFLKWGTNRRTLLSTLQLK